MSERRKPSDHAVVMAVIVTMRWVAYLLYGALAICLCASIWYGLKTGKYELAIITSLVTAVSAGANGAGGFMAGVLSQTFKSSDPQPVVGPDGGAVPVKEEEKEQKSDE